MTKSECFFSSFSSSLIKWRGIELKRLVFFSDWKRGREKKRIFCSFEILNVFNNIWWWWWWWWGWWTIHQQKKNINMIIAFRSFFLHFFPSTFICSDGGWMMFSFYFSIFDFFSIAFPCLSLSSPMPISHSNWTIRTFEFFFFFSNGWRERERERERERNE